MAASVKDVAARAGVSASTVSNYLNHPHLVADASRERIREAIDQLGFVPNESARQLRAGSGKMLALSLIDAWQPYFAELSRGVEDTVSGTPWSLMFSNSNRDEQQERDNLDMFDAHRVRGVIISPQGDVTERLDRLAQRGIASVLIGPPSTSSSFATVSFDDRGGGRLAGAHLLERGRHRIAFLGDPATVIHSAERLAGLTEAVSAHSARVDVIPTRSLTVEAGIDAALAIVAMDESERPDSIFAANDMVALGVLTGLLRAGIDVPGDIAIVGFDDIALSSQAIVPLTTVRQPGFEIGRAAAALLLEQLGDPAAPPPSRRPFAAELVVRDST